MSNKVALSDVVSYAQCHVRKPLEPPSRSIDAPSLKEDSENEALFAQASSVPNFVAGSGALDRLVNTANAYVR